MHFSTALLALAAAAGSVSATAIPRAFYGQWSVSATLAQDQTLSLTAKYTSSAYPDGLVRTCTENASASPPVKKSCSNPDFTYSYDGQTVRLQQSVSKPGRMTVFGDASMPYSQDLGNGGRRASATVTANRAMADVLHG